jgi:hypothetical protein
MTMEEYYTSFYNIAIWHVSPEIRDYLHSTKRTGAKG